MSRTESARAGSSAFVRRSVLSIGCESRTTGFFYDIIESDVLIIAIVPKDAADDWLNEFGIRPQL